MPPPTAPVPANATPAASTRGAGDDDSAGGGGGVAGATATAGTEREEKNEIDGGEGERGREIESEWITDEEEDEAAVAGGVAAAAERSHTNRKCPEKHATRWTALNVRRWHARKRRIKRRRRTKGNNRSGGAATTTAERRLDGDEGSAPAIGLFPAGGDLVEINTALFEPAPTSTSGLFGGPLPHPPPRLVGWWQCSG